MSYAILTDPVESMRLVGVSTALLHLDTLNECDRDLIAEHARRYWAEPDPLPQIGDIVRLDWAGIRTVRIARMLNDGQFQPARGTGGFHLAPEGLSFAGALDHPRPTGHLAALPRPQWARCWIFHQDMPHARAGRLDVEIPRRVWIYDRTYFA